MPKIFCDYELYNIDCLELFEKLPEGSVDAVIVDPPYGMTDAKWDSVIPLEEMWEGLKRVCKPNAAKVITATQPFTSILVCSNLREFKYVWTWEKEQAVGFLNAKKQPLRCVEDICVFYQKQPIYNPQMIPGKRIESLKKETTAKIYGKQDSQTSLTWYSSDQRYPRGLIKLDGIRKRRKGIHPTEKPVGLMQYLVKTYTDLGDTVLDFAMGSGTTGVACAIERRNFIGCDNDTEHGYFKVASDRIKKAYQVHA